MKPLKYRNDWVFGTVFSLIIIAGLFLAAAQFFQPPKDPAGQSAGARQELAMAGIESLIINYPDGPVALIAGTGDVISINEFTTFGQFAPGKLSVETDQGTATVSVTRTSHFPFDLFSFFSKARLEVTVPQTLLDNLKTLTINTTSGDISLPRLKTDRLELNTASGDIKTGQVIAANAVISSISGSIADLEIQTDQLDLGTTSGTISDLKLSGGTFKLHSVSGSFDNLNIAARDLTMNSISGSIKAEVNSPINSVSTTSGKIQLKLGAPMTNGEFRSVSGNVQLIIPNDTVEIEYSTTSGKIQINTVQVRNNGRIVVSTISGDINIDPD